MLYLMQFQLAAVLGRMNRPKPKSQRKPGQKPNGGQEGHHGHTLKKTETPDHIESYAPPERCADCGTPLENAVVAETRQVFDIPPLHFDVTEHQVLEAVCACGKTHRGEFPPDVSAPVVRSAPEGRRCATDPSPNDAGVPHAHHLRKLTYARVNPAR